MASTSIVSVFILTLFSFNFGIEASTNILPAKHTIHIHNGLPDNSPILKAHCASKGDDFGNHTLDAGQSFSWDFQTNIAESTLYFCRFWWILKTKAFDVFRAGWDADEYFHTYTYSVRTDGFYLGHEETPTEMSKVNTW
ncbi:hypothetical protein Salat_1719700 [Sesamum alatum]|uniref:S-protein homolog n=1 Tax=Sesamum alatum TaxID=300844 RepID=A0AAE1Y7R5_9LAMI|nr:hypothetical protein Salat_1719700 [Sesamum alatum]